MYTRFDSGLRLVLLLLAIFSSVSSLTKKFYYDPGTSGQTIKFLSDYRHTKVLHDFVDEVGSNEAEVIALEHAGFYSLKVINVNGSFVDDVWLFHAIPSWLCKFTYEEYLLTPVPTEFFYNRTAVLPCTILGSPQPQFHWQKYNSETEEWIDIASLGLLPPEGGRYYKSDVLGHLYIKHFNTQDTGLYRCRASNSCGGRCPNEPRCSREDVIGHTINLQLAVEDSDTTHHYFLNPIINHCWDTEGNYYESPKARFCSGLQGKASHIYSFSQYTSINSTANMEALFDFRRRQNDDADWHRVGSVRWNEYPDIGNFRNIEDIRGESGICIAKIEGFRRYNMEEYYYCAAYHPNELLMQGVRFEFVMKEAPYIGLPRGVPGKKMSRVIVAHYGSKQTMEFTIQITTPGFAQNKVHDKWICKFNGDSVSNNWHRRCAYNASNSDIVQFSLDYVVFGDAGYYQIIAGNDEGWAIGPPILLVVTGTEPDHGQYVLTELARTTERVTVRWNRPNVVDAGNLVYQVLCENRDWTEPVLKLLVHSVEWTEIRHLNPGVLYAITVWLHGGLVADTKEIRTLSIKTEAKVSFTCTPGATYIKCRWDEPDPSKFHSQSLTYMVSIKDQKRHETNTTAVSEEMQITLSNLRPHTPYKIKITACNLQGCADSHNGTSFQTEEERPGMVVFAEEPRPREFSVYVSLLYPATMPGVLETEVVWYEEENYNEIKEKLREESRQMDTIKQQNLLIVTTQNVTINDTSRIRYSPSSELILDSELVASELSISTEFTVTPYTPSPSDKENLGPRTEHLFETPIFEIVGLKQATTYYMKFRWKTGAGNGPFTPYMKIKIGRYIDYKKILIGCGVAAFFGILATGFCIYVNRRWPGLVKVVFQKIRDYINPSYMVPLDTLDEFHIPEEDPNIVYEFDMTENNI